MALSTYFDGKVEQDEYTQVHSFEYAIVNNVAVRSLWTRRSKTQTFTFTGCPSTDAHSTTAITVTDIDGNAYTFTPVSSFTDSSTGTQVFETESVTVRRRRMSYHMWELVVTRVGSEYYYNGTLRVAGPSWM